MPMLTPAQVHIDQPLTNLTIAYLQSTTGFIADQVFPNVPVTKQTDKYYIYNREDFNRSGNVKPLAPRTRPERVGMSLATDSYSIEVRGLATDFDFQTLANEDTALNIRAAQSQMLTMQLMIDREKRWASTYFTDGVWATEYTGIPGSGSITGDFDIRSWDEYSTSTPIIDVTEAKRAAQLASGGFRPNVMVVTRDVRDVLVHHPDILARLSGGATVSDTALVTDQKLAEIFEVSRFLVSDSIENTAAAGLAENNAFINTKKAALYYTPAAPGLMVPAAGYNFTWSTLDNSSGHGVEIRSYTGEYLAIEGIAEELHAVMAYDQKVVGNEMGVFFNDIIS
jgi:hypothetical protein